MTILLDHLTADASRSIPRAEGATAPQLWANPQRIVENGLRWYCGCFVCNEFKGPNLSAFDPRTGKLVRLFDPRRQRWLDHFSVRGVLILGRTATGRATVELLRMNAFKRQALRREVRG